MGAPSAMDDSRRAAPPGGPSLAPWAMLLLLAAAALRFHDAGHSILCGDELHAVRVATEHDWSEIPTLYQDAHNSIPLSLWARLLMETVGLTELRFRLLVMLSGLGLVAAPLLLRRRLGPAITLAAMALLASAPLEVYFSLMARPYAPASLALLGALAAWSAWALDGRRRARWPFVGLSFLAIVLHMFVLFPVLLLLVLAVRPPGRGPRAPALASAVLALGALLAAVYLPVVGDLLATRVDKVGQGQVDAVSLVRASLLLTGNVPALGALFGALLLLGTLRAALRREPLLLAAVGMTLVQVAAVLALQPLGRPTAWVRYLDLTWPISLLVVAAGLETVLQRAAAALGRPRHGPAATLSAALLLAAAVPLSSPMPIFDLAPSSFRTVNLGLLSGEDAGLPFTLPGVYGPVLADDDPGAVLLECPLPRNDGEWWRLMASQRAHGLPVVLVLPDVQRLKAAGMELRSLQDLRDPAALRALGARYLVVHRAILPAPLLQDVARRYGPPIASDEHLDLHRVPPAP